jgi:hypothetical protein
MAAVPLEQSGQLPPPAKVTLQWKEDAMARLGMAKVGEYDFVCLLWGVGRVWT